MPLELALKLLRNETEKLISQLEKDRASAVICLYCGIEDRLVDTVARHIEKKRQTRVLKDRLDIILHTAGGSPDAAFNIGRLFQRSASNVCVIVPRMAKSAGTLLACSADEIIMFETSELGPLDTQILHLDENGKLLDRFSALAVRSAEKSIKQELKKGHKEYAEILARRMPDAIKTTELLRTLEISQKYLRELLYKRMFKKGTLSTEDKEDVCNRLVEGYSHHGYVIDIKEAKKKLKLNIKIPKDKEQENLIKNIHALHIKIINLHRIINDNR